MSRWLFKSDPETYGFHDLVRDKQTVWDGVRNPVALRNLRSAKKGDAVFIYHTGEEKAIVGLAEIVKDGYPDPKNPGLTVVDLKALRAVRKPVTLAAVKQDKSFSDFALVRQPRLSVMPVSEQQWKLLMKMAGE